MSGVSVQATFFHHTKKVSLAELLPADPRCPICHREQPRRSVGVLQADPRVDLLQCPHCGGASASQMPHAEVLRRFYDEYYQANPIHEDDRKNPIRVTLDPPTRFARHIAQRVARTERPLAILDFGGGDGTLGRLLGEHCLQRGSCSRATVTVVDPTAPGVQAGGAVEVTHLHTLDALPPGSTYDVVLASAVLEHIPELHETLRSLFARVAPGGLFYARTPFMAPFASFVRMDFGFPGHVHDMGPEFWDQIVPLFGLRARLIASQPSLVETTFRYHPMRTVAAHVLKLGSRLEIALRGPPPRSLRWRWVGGWEVFVGFEP